MKYLSLLIVPFVLLAAVRGAAVERESATGLTGVNIVASDLAIRKNEARTCNNLDLSRVRIGSASLREGFDSISALSGMDSCLDFTAAYYKDGTQELLSVFDSTGVGYGGLYVSPSGDDQFSGSNLYTLTISEATRPYTYVDSIFVGSDTIVDTFRAIDSEDGLYAIYRNLRDSLNANATFLQYFTATAVPLKVKEEMAGLTVTFATDTTQSLDTAVLNIESLWMPFSVQRRPWFAQFNDQIFVVNGAQKGVAYNRQLARSYPPNALGEPTLTPLDNDGGPNGEYRYAFRSAPTEDADSLGRIGFVSDPVRVENGQVLIKDFTWMPGDSVTPAPDSIWIVGYRTKANPGRLDKSDYAFSIGTVALASSASGLGSIKFIDSLSDADLSAADSVPLLQPETYTGLDDTGVLVQSYGAPSYDSALSFMSYDSADADAEWGIFYGIPEQNDTGAVMYAVTVMDTVFGVESGLSAGLAVYVDADSAVGNKLKPKGYSITVPNIPYGDSGLVVNVYRAHILQVTYDSNFTPLDTFLTRLHNFFYKGDVKWVLPLGIDTVVVSEFRLVEQLKQGQTTLVDSINWDSLQSKRIYRDAVPPIFSGILSYDNLLVGWDGSTVAWSDLDSGGVFGVFNRKEINPDDGDQINVCYGGRYFHVYKNYSNYILYNDFADVQKVGDWGCIAPKSFAAGSNGRFYLSAEGVVFETDGKQLERTVEEGLISKKLKGFTYYSFDVRRKAVGRWLPEEQKYLISFHGSDWDTTWVYDKAAADAFGEEVWYSWTGLTFAAGTLYGTETTTDFVPGTDFYFTKPGESKLYKYGGVTTDPDTTAVQFEYRTGPWLVDYPYKARVGALGIRASDAPDSEQVSIELLGETGSLLADTINVTDLDEVYQFKQLEAAAPALEHHLRLFNQPGLAPFVYMTIDAIDVYFEPRTEPLLLR